MINIIDNTWQQVDVFISFGQSNATASQGIDNQLIPISPNGAFIWLVQNDITTPGNSSIQPLEFRTTTGNRYSSIDLVTCYWASQTNKEVYHFKHAQGATSLYYDWNANTIGGYADRLDNEWDLFVAALHSIKRYPRVICISWIQFERDLNKGEDLDVSQYFTRWKALRNRIDNKIGYWNRWICWPPNSLLLANNPVKAAKVIIFQSIFDYEIGKEGSTYIYDTDALELVSDNLHFSDQSIVNAGLANFNLVLSIIEDFNINENTTGGGIFA